MYSPPIFECTHGHVCTTNPGTTPKRCPHAPHGTPCTGTLRQIAGAGARSAA